MDPKFQIYETRIRNPALFLIFPERAKLGHEVLYEGGKTRKLEKKGVKGEKAEKPRKDERP